MLRGNIKYFVDGNSYNLKEGDFVLIAPGKLHFAEVFDPNNYERYVIKFNASTIPSCLHEKLFLSSSFFKQSPKFTMMFKDFENDYDRFISDEEKYILYACNIIKLCINLANEKNIEEPDNDSLVKNILQYIDQHIYENITLSTLSSVFLFSKSYISAKFKQKTKVSIIKYIKVKKVLFAHKLILDGVKKSEAAKMMGFEDYSTFYRCYVKIVGNNIT